MNPKIPFIDRELELGIIKQAICAQHTHRVIGIQAEGGIGKTRLLQEVQRLYKETVAGRELNLLVAEDILDFDDRANQISHNVGLRIAQMLGTENFKPYFSALLNYRKLEKAEVPYTRLQEAEKLNNQAFVRCFNQVAHKKRIVVLLDTTEKLAANADYLHNWIEQSQNAVWILVGRPESEIIQWIKSKQNEDFTFLELLALSPEAGQRYLQAKQEPLFFTLEPDLANKLRVLAQGRPILIDLAVEWLARNIPMLWLTEIKTPELETLSQVEKKQKLEEFEKQLVLSVAIMRRPMDRLILAMSHVFPLNVAILEKLLHVSHSIAQNLFQESKQYVFVKALPDGRITLHDEMRRMVQTYVWPEVDPDNERRRVYSKIAAEHLEEQASTLKEQIAQLQAEGESTGLQEDEALQFDNSLRRQALERELWVVQESFLYHTLVIDLEQSIDVFARLFDEATHAYAFDLRKLFYMQMQAYDFDNVTLESQYKFYSRKIRHLNDSGEFEAAQTLTMKLLADDLKNGQRLDLLSLSGRSYELSHNLFKALEQYQAALEMCERYSELSPWKSRILNNLGRVTREMALADQSLEYYQQALSIAEVPDHIAAALNNIGYVWALQGRYRGAHKYCRKALLIYENLNQERNIGTTLATIGEVFRSQSAYAQAIDYYYQAYPYFQRANDLIWLARIYARRGAVHRLQTNYGLAIQDLEASIRCNIREEQPWAYHVWGCVYWNQKDWAAAEEKFRQSNELAHEVGDVRSQVNNLVGYAELYFDRWADSQLKDNGYPEKIREKARQLEVLLEQGYGFYHHYGRIKRALADVYYYEARYDLAFENYKEAYTLLGSRLGGYARLTNFEGEVDWLSARIIELATLGQSDLAITWCQNFRTHWENAELQMMQRDLLLSMCDICEMDVKLRAKGVL